MACNTSMLAYCIYIVHEAAYEASLLLQLSSETWAKWVFLTEFRSMGHLNLVMTAQKESAYIFQLVSVLDKLNAVGKGFGVDGNCQAIHDSPVCSPFTGRSSLIVCWNIDIGLLKADKLSQAFILTMVVVKERWGRTRYNQRNFLEIFSWNLQKISGISILCHQDREHFWSL